MANKALQRNILGIVVLVHQVERLLDGVDAVIYILDYTKLKTKEEAELLQKLKVCAGRSPSLN